MVGAKGVWFGSYSLLADIQCIHVHKLQHRHTYLASNSYASIDHEYSLYLYDLMIEHRGIRIEVFVSILETMVCISDHLCKSSRSTLHRNDYHLLLVVTYIYRRHC